MGKGYMIKCKKCGFEFSVNYGIGFFYPQVYEEVIEKIKNGKLGEEIKVFFDEHPDAAVDASTTALLCEKCGNLEFDEDLSVYLPSASNIDDEKNGRWSVAFPAEGYKFVMPSELKEYYRKIMDYPHYCSKCSGKLKIISEKEFHNLRCPECNEEMEDAGVLFWD